MSFLVFHPSNSCSCSAVGDIKVEDGWICVRACACVCHHRGIAVGCSCYVREETVAIPPSSIKLLTD